MKASVYSNRNNSILRKMPKNQKYINDSARAICEEAALLAYNSAIQSCNSNSTAPKVIGPFYLNSISEIKKKIIQPTDSTMDKFEKIKTIHDLLIQLQKISTKYQCRDQ